MPILRSTIAFTNRTNLMNQLGTALQTVGWIHNTVGGFNCWVSPSLTTGQHAVVQFDVTLGKNGAGVVNVPILSAQWGNAVAAGGGATGVGGGPIQSAYDNADIAGSVEFVGNEYWFHAYTNLAHRLGGGLFSPFYTLDPQPVWCLSPRWGQYEQLNADAGSADFCQINSHGQMDGIDGTSFGNSDQPVIWPNGFNAAFTPVKRGPITGAIILPAVICNMQGFTVGNREGRGVLPRAIVALLGVSPAPLDTITALGGTFQNFNDGVAGGSVAPLFLQTA